MQKKLGIFRFRFLPLIFIFFAVGIAFACLLPHYFAFIVLAVLSVFAIYCFASKKHRKRGFLILLFMMIFVASFVYSFSLIDSKNSKEFYFSEVNIVGTVSDKSQFDENGNVKENGILENVKIYGDKIYKLKNYVFVKSKLDGCQVGDKLEFIGTINNLTLFPQDSYSVGNYCDKIDYITTVDDIISISKDKLSLSFKLRLNLKQTLYKNTNNNVATVIYAMLTGESSEMDENVSAAFRKIGIAHLFAVSGLHIGLIAGIVSLIVKKLKLNKLLDILLTISVILLYSLFCGFTPSVLRAFTMIVIFKISNIIGTRNDSLSTLSLSATILLLINPIFLFDISYILSFSAVFGIVLFFRSIEKTISKIPKLPKIISSTLSMTLAVNILILPIMLFYFKNVSLLFLIANVFLIPIVSFVFPFIFIASVVAMILPFMGFVLTALGWVIATISIVGIGLAKVKFFEITITPQWYIVVSYLILAFLLSKFSRYSLKFKKISVLIILPIFSVVTIFSTFAGYIRPNTLDTLKADYLGEIVLLETSFNENYLVFNRDFQLADIYDIKRSLAENSISRIDGVIKYEFSYEELVALKLLNFEYIYIFDINLPYLEDFGYNIHSNIKRNNVKLFFADYNEIVLTIENTNILFLKGYKKIVKNYYDYHIIYSYNSYEAALELSPQYIVNDYAYNTNRYKGIPNYFTFKLNNGKIKVLTNR